MSLKLAAPLSDAVYDLRLGLLGSEPAAMSTPSPLFLFSDAVYDLRIGRFGLGFQAMGA